jgi:hypothetical protein
MKSGPALVGTSSGLDFIPAVNHCNWTLGHPGFGRMMPAGQALIDSHGALGNIIVECVPVGGASVACRETAGRETKSFRDRHRVEGGESLSGWQHRHFFANKIFNEGVEIHHSC